MVVQETISAYSSSELSLACSALALFFPVVQGEDLQGRRCMATSAKQHCCFCSVWALQDASSLLKSISCEQTSVFSSCLVGGKPKDRCTELQILEIF